MRPIYLDYNATTPLDPGVAEAMRPFIEQQFGNPSSSHLFGAEARKAVDLARKQIAAGLGCDLDEIVFTSGGSESNNYAILGVAHAFREKGNHIITSVIEHPAVLEVCRFLEKEGFRITVVGVDEHGMVDPADVAKAITPQTILITIMHANNEVGTIQDIRQIADLAHERGILVHTDAAQSIGKIPVRLDDLNVDLLTVAGHKLYAPKGIGALYVRSGIKLGKLIHGADHELNRRAGTENVIGIAGLGRAFALIEDDPQKNLTHLTILRDKLEETLLSAFPESRINGHRERRLPNTCSISFRGLEANTILSDLEAVAASAGAACHSDEVDVSHVLEAMQVPLEYAMGTIRFSVGRFTTDDDIDMAAEEIIKVVKRLRPQSGISPVYVGEEEIKLTRFTHGLGCACKLRPQVLETVLKKLKPVSDKQVLIGAENADDAAVYKLSEEMAVVQTVDFFTPVVDDPFSFGAIAAANSLSDIYAMGGKPLFGLNIVGFPSNRLPVSVLQDILNGAQSVAESAGISIIGGHTVDDTEPKFGLAVTGMVHPDRIIRNSGALPGDMLVLTKPIGTGIQSTALKQGDLDEDRKQTLMRTMISLNEKAAESMLEVGVHACTDITGFGLLGHLREMMLASKTSAVIDFSSIVFLDGTFELAVSGIIPGGTRDNFAFTESSVRYPGGLSEIKRLLLNDAQTSGGLLISVSPEKSGILVERLKKHNVEQATVIGKVTEKTDKDIIVEQNTVKS